MGSSIFEKNLKGESTTQVNLESQTTIAPPDSATEVAIPEMGTEVMLSPAQELKELQEAVKTKVGWTNWLKQKVKILFRKKKELNESIDFALTRDFDTDVADEIKQAVVEATENLIDVAQEYGDFSDEELFAIRAEMGLLMQPEIEVMEKEEAIKEINLLSEVAKGVQEEEAIFSRGNEPESLLSLFRRGEKEINQEAQERMEVMKKKLIQEYTIIKNPGLTGIETYGLFRSLKTLIHALQTLKSHYESFDFEDVDKLLFPSEYFTAEELEQFNQLGEIEVQPFLKLVELQFEGKFVRKENIEEDFLAEISQQQKEAAQESSILQKEDTNLLQKATKEEYFVDTNLKPAYASFCSQLRELEWNPDAVSTILFKNFLNFTDSEIALDRKTIIESILRTNSEEMGEFLRIMEELPSSSGQWEQWFMSVEGEMKQNFQEQWKDLKQKHVEIFPKMTLADVFVLKKYSQHLQNQKKIEMLKAKKHAINSLRLPLGITSQESADKELKHIEQEMEVLSENVLSGYEEQMIQKLCGDSFDEIKQFLKKIPSEYSQDFFDNLQFDVNEGSTFFSGRTSEIFQELKILLGKTSDVEKIEKVLTFINQQYDLLPQEKEFLLFLLTNELFEEMKVIQVEQEEKVLLDSRFEQKLTDCSDIDSLKRVLSNKKDLVDFDRVIDQYTQEFFLYVQDIINQKQQVIQREIMGQYYADIFAHQELDFNVLKDKIKIWMQESADAFGDGNVGLPIFIRSWINEQESKVESIQEEEKLRIFLSEFFEKLNEHVDRALLAMQDEINTLQTLEGKKDFLKIRGVSTDILQRAEFDLLENVKQDVLHQVESVDSQKNKEFLEEEIRENIFHKNTLEVLYVLDTLEGATSHEKIRLQTTLNVLQNFSQLLSNPEIFNLHNNVQEIVKHVGHDYRYYQLWQFINNGPDIKGTFNLEVFNKYIQLICRYELSSEQDKESIKEMISEIKNTYPFLKKVEEFANFHWDQQKAFYIRDAQELQQKKEKEKIPLSSFVTASSEDINDYQEYRSALAKFLSDQEFDEKEQEHLDIDHINLFIKKKKLSKKVMKYFPNPEKAEFNTWFDEMHKEGYWHGGGQELMIAILKNYDQQPVPSDLLWRLKRNITNQLELLTESITDIRKAEIEREQVLLFRNTLIFGPVNSTLREVIAISDEQRSTSEKEAVLKGMLQVLSQYHVYISSSLQKAA